MARAERLIMPRYLSLFNQAAPCATVPNLTTLLPNRDNNCCAHRLSLAQRIGDRRVPRYVYGGDGGVPLIAYHLLLVRACARIRCELLQLNIHIQMNGY
jgi:hypothetical protein